MSNAPWQFDACGLTIVHPCRVKSFQKAVSMVMDDLVMMLANKIIDNLHLVIIVIKLASLCECLWIVYSWDNRVSDNRLGIVWCYYLVGSWLAFLQKL